MLSAGWNLLFFIIAIGILVAIHEAGHFFAARYCKVKVYRFSLGFGPVIWKRTGKDGVEYAISAIPLGGYVKMKGEQENEQDNEQVNEYTHKYANKSKGQSNDHVLGEKQSSTHGFTSDFAEFRTSSENKDFSLNQSSNSSFENPDEQDSFKDKSIKQRAFIIAAGPLCNIILAFILYTIINIIGVQTIKPVVGYVEHNSRAEVATLQYYDLITKVNGHDVGDWQGVIFELVNKVGEKVDLEVVSEVGNGSSRIVSLDLHNLSFDPKKDLLDEIGILPCVGKVPESISIIEENSPAERAGLEKGDVVLSINKQPVRIWFDLSRIIDNATAEETLVFEVKRGEEILFFEVTPDIYFNEQTQREHAKVGLGIMIEHMPELDTVKKYGFFDAIVQASNDTARMGFMIFNGLKKMITGEISTKSIGGPITLAKGAGNYAEVGLVAFMWFLATLSINLGVLNLLPIPVLDGGQLLFVAYEGLTKRKPNQRIQNVLTMMGLSIVLLLTFLAIFNDLSNL